MCVCACMRVYVHACACVCVCVKGGVFLSYTEVLWPGAHYGGTWCENGLCSNDTWPQKAPTTNVSVSLLIRVPNHNSI